MSQGTGRSSHRPPRGPSGFCHRTVPAGSTHTPTITPFQQVLPETLPLALRSVGSRAGPPNPLAGTRTRGGTPEGKPRLRRKQPAVPTDHGNGMGPAEAPTSAAAAVHPAAAGEADAGSPLGGPPLRVLRTPDGSNAPCCRGRTPAPHRLNPDYKTPTLLMGIRPSPAFPGITG